MGGTRTQQTRHVGNLRGGCSRTRTGLAALALSWGSWTAFHLCGVDIDNCCDAQTGKFTPESREIVIGLDSYSEYSPSGTGATYPDAWDVAWSQGYEAAVPWYQGR